MMKKWKDMSNEEQDDFLSLVRSVSVSMASAPRPPGLNDHHVVVAAMLLVKIFDQTLLNAEVQFDLDPEGFVRDTIEIGRRFFENSNEMGNPDSEIDEKFNIIIRIIGDPRFPAQVDQFAKLVLKEKWR